jgi:drug/metabolite transporter (DMT)-like permease
MATAGLSLLTLRGAAGFGAGELLVLGCAICFAWHILFLDRAAGKTPPVVLGAVQNAVVAVVTATLAAGEPLPQRVPWTIWLAILGMGAAASALAFSVQAWAQRFTTPAHVGLIFASEPVAAAVIARIAIGEAMTGRQWIGAAFILGGIVVAELARPREGRPPGPAGSLPLGGAPGGDGPSLSRRSTPT